MKKLTLTETWVLCLRMWRWIAKEVRKGSKRDVWTLKGQWLKENGFNPSKIHERCFFCDFTINDCKSCPGRKVDVHFDCQDTEYDYADNPCGFYAELLRLNRIRKAKK